MRGRCYSVTLFKKKKKKVAFFSVVLFPRFTRCRLLQQYAAEGLHVVSKFCVLILTPFNINLAIVSRLPNDKATDTHGTHAVCMFMSLTHRYMCIYQSHLYL